MTSPASSQVSGSPADLAREAEGAELLTAVTRLHRWATRHTRIPISVALARLLAQIDDLGPSRIGDLARADQTSQPTMTTQVHKLEELGMVSRVADPTDARAVLVGITALGSERLTEIRLARAAAVAPLLADLTPEERDRLSATLRALHRVLDIATRHT